MTTIYMTHAVLTDSEFEARILPLARGCYQRSLLQGREYWSGSSLRGKAKTYGVHYYNSACNLIKRIREAGYQASYLYDTEEHGAKKLVIWR